ncbi:hypothetical protein [Salibacterium qingdaonense]|uniref:DUF4355 domain-containing protein n=1 Tax=Salibacterium qingdaonense TaxID=266892 RepID=A0A1I4QM58_9BACI|nr:hypothetical protein [Salibacterium qingdaonense]SFM41192.1 hypothetical protein SAMN04488054_14511 [Salibacterium qingdaonense]
MEEQQQQNNLDQNEGGVNMENEKENGTENQDTSNQQQQEQDTSTDETAKVDDSKKGNNQADQLAQREKELFQKEVQLTLKEKGLDDFADIVQVNSKDELDSQIEQLEAVVNKRKLDNSYVPEDHAKQDEYSTAEKQKDSQGMIASKLNKFFQ